MIKIAPLRSEQPLRYDEVNLAAFNPEELGIYKSQKFIHTLTGFKIPTLPVAREVGASPAAHLAQVLHRFVVFIRALHQPGQRRAIALQIAAHPDRSTLGAEVGVYLLCRTAAPDYAQAVRELDELAAQVYQLFPTEGLFNYDTPTPLAKEELQRITFQHLPDNELKVVELRKFEDNLIFASPDARFIPPGIDYMAHPFWADTHLDPWLNLIETLAGQSVPAAITLVLEPTALVEQDIVAALAQQFRSIAQEGLTRSELLDQAAGISATPFQQRSLIQMMSLVRFYRAQGLTDYLVARAQRGAYVYGQLMAWQDQLFTLRVILAAQGRQVPETLIQAVRAVLSSPTPGTDNNQLGWVRPAVIRPEGSQQEEALQNLRWLGQVDWGDSLAYTKLRRLRYLTSAQEAVGLFHLPVMPQAGQTTALSTADVPFVIPPEVASTHRFKPEDTLLKLGYLYQRGRCLIPEAAPSNEAQAYQPGLSGSRPTPPDKTANETNVLAFQVQLADLEKPSLLVGSPGSGKSNLALYLLIQLWQEHQVPFLVLDPSTGHEYRYLYSEPALKNDLLVYTLGDEEGLPFRFNPFEVPPGVTVRGHITRLLACFKAAYEMWDPLPAIYEAALARVYTQPPYNWPLDEKGGSGRPSPCLADFARAVMDELEENVLPDYGKGTEAAGILTGASKIRVNSILKNLDYILNVRQTDPLYFQKLLDRPTVIELGALGDPSNIALVMAFLITQLAGHIEAAFPQRKLKEKPHLLLIEEAHRLLSAETTATASPNQGNTRGKSAEELNSMLAEVRKFKQGIMVLDQRPSSLVGGVLDNALINIMCRLNDRVGFEHLSNVLNLSPAQQRYARTRLKPGDALVLDAESGQPVLTRAPEVIDGLRAAHLSPNQERERMYANARRAELLPPEAEQVRKQPAAASAVGDTFVSRDEDYAWLQAIKIALDREDWPGVDTQLRVWLKRQTPTGRLKGALLRQTVALLDYPMEQQNRIIKSFEENL